jgi:hypothetical protein
MAPDDSAILEAREANDTSVPRWLLGVLLAALLLGPVGYTWLKATPPVWNATSPPSTIRFCGRDYRDPHRYAARLPSDPAAVEPIVEAIDGQRLQLPAIQTTRFNGADVCATVFQVHDAQGWVAYGLVGGP